MHCAAANFNSEYVEALLKAGADKNIKDKKGHTPLEAAVNESTSSGKESFKNNVVVLLQNTKN